MAKATRLPLRPIASKIPMRNFEVLNVRLYNQTIGTLTRLPGDRVLFGFTDDYIANRDRPTLSLSFKDAFGSLRFDTRPTQTRLPAFFSNLLPEGPMRDYLAARAKTKPEREFFLMSVLGRDLPGALEIRPIDGAPLFDPDGNANVSSASEPDEVVVMRFSLAGIQLKFSAIKDARGGLTVPADGAGGSWIVKLPSAKFPHVPENEFSMMELARRIGIDVPKTALVPIKQIANLPKGLDAVGERAFTIKRFDRKADGQRVHIEDFAQVFDVYPERKYERASYRNIASVIWTETGQVGTVEFLRRFVFNALIGNADMHLKNWSLIYPDRRAAMLAPAYDFVSTVAYLPDDRLALTFMDSKEFSSLTLDQFRRFAEKARLPEKLTLDTVQETVSRFSQAWRESGTLDIPATVRQAIDRHLPTLPLWS
jgi:serine/threonine-protein kinase HipA